MTVNLPSRVASLEQLFIDVIKLGSNGSRSFFHEIEAYLKKSEDAAEIMTEISQVASGIDQEQLVEKGHYVGVYDFKSFLAKVNLYDQKDELYGKIREFAFNGNDLFMANMANGYYNISFDSEEHKAAFNKDKIAFFDRVFNRAVYDNDRKNAQYALEGKINCVSKGSETWQAWKDQLDDFDNDFEKRCLPKRFQELKKNNLDDAAKNPKSPS